ncbi:S-layer homology domain-containing protein [Paenibacillus sp. UNC499MF]|uniref:S-layer homology domain-containing protein n=1 Tax=Paenibacillus sp. UNC499MF TaxID=1502751 RepID=UPI0008A08AEF|nr:S-layer homology domain-containing protein [Paenibacillus sp. UNC499MF]SEF42814.1 S-layer homology domain-containing protein [Paenibacillus sp. UNC499MF]
MAWKKVLLTLSASAVLTSAAGLSLTAVGRAAEAENLAAGQRKADVSAVRPEGHSESETAPVYAAGRAAPQEGQPPGAEVPALREHPAGAEDHAAAPLTAGAGPAKPGTAPEAAPQAAASGSAEQPAAGRLYADVAPDDRNADAIADLAARGLIEGTASGRFDPAGALTREQFAKLLASAFGLGTSEGPTPFVDLVSVWSTPYISAAYAAGLVDGVTAVKFMPAQPVTRQAAAAMVWRWLEARGVEAPADAAAWSVGDADVWAQASVQNIMALGLRSDSGDDYEPKRVMTRGDAATLVSRALALLERTAVERAAKAAQPLTADKAASLIRYNEQKTSELLLSLFDHELASRTKPPFKAIEPALSRYYADPGSWRTFYEHHLGGIYEAVALFPAASMPGPSFKIVSVTDDRVKVRGKRPEGAYTDSAFLTYTLLKRNGSWVIGGREEEKLTEPFTREEAEGIVARYYRTGASLFEREESDSYLFTVTDKGEKLRLSVSKSKGILALEES